MPWMEKAVAHGCGAPVDITAACCVGLFGWMKPDQISVNFCQVRPVFLACLRRGRFEAICPGIRPDYQIIAIQGIGTLVRLEHETVFPLFRIKGDGIPPNCQLPQTTAQAVVMLDGIAVGIPRRHGIEGLRVDGRTLWGFNGGRALFRIWRGRGFRRSRACA